ncbi:MAG: hypothetical protein IPG06_02235 [Haliea sp.]|nr:hypothetical protein [Haliea sp.]
MSSITLADSVLRSACRLRLPDYGGQVVDEVAVGDVFKIKGLGVVLNTPGY